MSAVKDRPRPVVRTRVEPRIVERRRRVRHEQSLRRRRGLIVIGVVAALIVASIGVLLSPLLDVEQVDVVGSSQLAPEEIIELSGIERGSPMVSVDVGTARELLRSHRLVASARVTRTWPGSIQITVVEEQPLVLVRHGGAESVLSAAGRVLEPADAGGGEALFVVGSERALDARPGDRVEGPLRSAVSMVDQMDPGLRSQVTQMLIASDDTVVLELDDGATVRVGRLDGIPAKLLAIETALAQIVPDCIETLDVTEAQLATVRRVPGCEVPPPTVVLDADSESVDADADSTGGTDDSATGTSDDE